MLSAMSVAHGGGILPIFSESTYNYLCGKEITNMTPSIDEIADHSLKIILDQVGSMCTHSLI